MWKWKMHTVGGGGWMDGLRGTVDKNGAGQLKETKPDYWVT